MHQLPWLKPRRHSAIGLCRPASRSGVLQHKNSGIENTYEVDHRSNRVISWININNWWVGTHVDGHRMHPDEEDHPSVAGQGRWWRWDGWLRRRRRTLGFTCEGRSASTSPGTEPRRCYRPRDRGCRICWPLARGRHLLLPVSPLRPPWPVAVLELSWSGDRWKTSMAGSGTARSGGASGG